MKTLQERKQILENEFNALVDTKKKLNEQLSLVENRLGTLQSQYALLEDMIKDETPEVIPEVLDTSNPTEWQTNAEWPKKRSKKESQPDAPSS